MPSSSSVGSEYYKLQYLWKEIDDNPEWRLAIWSAQAPDTLLIDKFLEVERSPLGEFDDIFFRFETPYEDDTESYDHALWAEYISWFEEKLPEKYDILGALKKDGLLKMPYAPDKKAERTAAGLWKEMLRFKASIRGLEERNFCLHLRGVDHGGISPVAWYEKVLKDGIPKGIRLTVIDYAGNRKIKVKESPEVIVLRPELNMRDAIANDVSKNCDSYNPMDVAGQFNKQVQVTLECAAKKDESLLTKEVNKLIGCAAELNNADLKMSAPLIAAQAYYMADCFDKSSYHADKVISESGEAMKKEETTNAYTLWKAAMFQKGAILSAKKKYKEAIDIYEAVADEATPRGDIMFIMDAYRMVGFLYYQIRKNSMALEYFLLSLAAGAYLNIEVRRQSSFLYSAGFALILCREIHKPEEVGILERQLHEWLGDDWEELIENGRMSDAVKRKKTLF